MDTASDMASVVSHAESGVESELDGFEEDVDPAAAPVEPEDPPAHAVEGYAQPGPGQREPAPDDDILVGEHAGRGQHTVWSSGYFTLQNDPGVPYVCTLGTACSKQISRTPTLSDIEFEPPISDVVSRTHATALYFCSASTILAVASRSQVSMNHQIRRTILGVATLCFVRGMGTACVSRPCVLICFK